MIYFILAFVVFAMFACMACIFAMFRKVSDLERICDMNMDAISRHAAEHVHMAEEQEEAASRIAEQIEKKWDTGLQKMLAWDPFSAKSESEDN